MPTGVPIYLVSACGSGEEFVAAFRRYSDRGSLFVPIAEPLPPGRRGRIALTLSTGGVMLEGDVEIVSSSKTASILHGRVGMTIRFVEPDEETKTLLVELDRARLAARPSPPTIAPRPADVPPTPRPVAPAPGGRIDAANARAECVSIGDLASLREGSAPTKPGQKFVMPSIPGAGKKVPTIPPKLGTAPAEPLPIPVVAPVVPSRPFRLPTPPPEEPVDDGQAAQIVDRPPAKLPPTATQPSAVVPMPTKQSRAEQNQTIRGVKPAPSRMTTLGVQALHRTSPMPMPVAPRPSTQDVLGEESTDLANLAELRSTAPSIDAHARTMPASATLQGAADESPDENAGDWTMAPSDPTPTPLTVEPRPLPAGPMTGNWTIALTPEGWGEVEKVAASLPAPGPPTAVSGETGPFATSVTGEKPLLEKRADPDVDADEGKIQVDPTLMEPLTAMPQLDPTPVPGSGSTSGSVPALLPAPPSRPTPMALPPPPSSTSPYPMMMAQSQPSSEPPRYVAPPLPQMRGTGANAAYPEPETRMFEDVAASQARMAQDPTTLLQIKRKRRLVVIIAAAFALAALAIVIGVMASSRGKTTEAIVVIDDAPRAVAEHAMPPPIAVDAAVPLAVPVDAAEPAVDAGVEDCRVEIVTIPKDVEIAIDATTKLGTAPGAVKLPCGTEVKLYLRKPGYAGVIKTITPVAGMKPLRFVLAKALVAFAVRVSSAPAGATITAGGKTLGVTPTVVRLSGTEPVVLVIAKEGYVPQEQRIAPKAQIQVVTVKLVPKKRSGR